MKDKQDLSLDPFSANLVAQDLLAPNPDELDPFALPQTMSTQPSTSFELPPELVHSLADSYQNGNGIAEELIATHQQEAFVKELVEETPKTEQEQALEDLISTREILPATSSSFDDLAVGFISEDASLENSLGQMESQESSIGEGGLLDEYQQETEPTYSISETSEIHQTQELVGEDVDVTFPIEAEKEETPTKSLLEEVAGDPIGEIVSKIDAPFATRALLNGSHPTSQIKKGSVEAKSEQIKYLGVTLGGRGFALPVANVLEIALLPNITFVPNTPFWLLGVMNLRGDILSVVDLKTFLGLEATEVGATNRLLVVRSLQEDLTIGLVVDRVNGFIRTTEQEVEKVELGQQKTLNSYMQGVCEYQGHLYAVFDLEKLLLSPEMRCFEMA
ncbi:MAG: purine-binding chemotaxis protein CheW [Blastocatellia bacterium]|nr:purine-binding chemotaxis protein CheW [Blastocatellia bacterium]